jgi:rare lipoprotein A
MSSNEFNQCHALNDHVQTPNAGRHRRVGVLLSALLGIVGLNLAHISPALADVAGPAKTFSGKVSWYGPGFDGRKTASGEIFDMKKNTAAHLKLKFGTKVLVENPKNGKTVVVKVNDRGPYAKGRVMDLSRGAAEKLGTLLGGVAYLDCTVLDKDDPQASLNRYMIISGDTVEDGKQIALIPVSKTLSAGQNASI